MRIRRALQVTVAVIGLTALWQSPVLAAASVSNGKISCTVTAQAATLSKTSLTAKASVVCTGATTASVTIGLSEYDGTVEQVVQTPKKISVAVTKANTAFAVSGTTMTCLSTEVGNEEYASKVQVTLTTSTGTLVSSSWDVKIPANDAFKC